MAFITEEKLKQDLKSGRLCPVYILFGDDAYLKTLYLKKISGAVAEEDDVFNFVKYTGQCDLQEVYDSVMQLPVMSDRKCVIINDYDYEHCAKKDFERLEELIAEVPEETVLILYFDGIETDRKKGAKFKKLVADAEKHGGAAVALDHRSAAQLSKMLSDGAAKRGVKMELAVARYLVETAGDDIFLLTNELEKLCAFVKDGIITKADVDNVCTHTVEADIFKLTGCILAKKSTEALIMLDELLFMRVEYMSVFYTVASTFVDMYRVYAARAQNLPISEVESFFKYGNKAFLVRNAAANLRNLDSRKLTLCLDILTKTDDELKSFGAAPRTVLEKMIVRLIYVISTGESLD